MAGAMYRVHTLASYTQHRTQNGAALEYWRLRRKGIEATIIRTFDGARLLPFETGTNHYQLIDYHTHAPAPE